MDASPCEPTQPSRLRLLLDHFSRIEDKRSPEGVAHKLNEILANRGLVARLFDPSQSRAQSQKT